MGNKYGATTADAVIYIAKRIFNIVNTSAIVTLALVIWSIIALAVVVKLDGNQIMVASSYIFKESIAQTLLIIALVLSNIFWWLLRKKDKEIYELRIEKLTETRKVLMHIRGNGEFTPIKKHRSTKNPNDIREAHIFPDKENLKNE